MTSRNAELLLLSPNTVSKMTRFEMSFAMATKGLFSAQRRPLWPSGQPRIQRIGAALSPVVQAVGRYTSSVRGPRCAAPILQPCLQLLMLRGPISAWWPFCAFPQVEDRSEWSGIFAQCSRTGPVDIIFESRTVSRATRHAPDPCPHPSAGPICKVHVL